MIKLSIIILFFASFAMCRPVLAEFTEIGTSYGHSVFASYEPFNVEVSSGWITVNALAMATDMGKETIDEIELMTGFLSLKDLTDVSQALPSFLIRQHSAYFVNVFKEEDVAFSVIYRDDYGNMPSSGYPEVIFWPEGTQDYTTLQLDRSDTLSSGYLYQKKLPLARGVYYYKYSVRNDQLLSEYNIETSSFVVAARPQNVENKGAADSSVVSNGKVVFKWDAQSVEESGLTYKLYVGDSPDNLKLVYEGTDSSYEAKSLDSGKNYFWQVEAANIYGVSTKSSIYKFSTISDKLVSKAFNYPNPFNPIRQKTNFVFNMADDGYAEISVYTELGDLCWQKIFYGLNRGANEIQYDGKDDQGQTLYNGTYVCIFKKKYQQGEAKDHCRILIIK